MRKLAFIGSLILLVLSSNLCEAQKKVKYKDIFGLLNVKQYEQAEPFLKTFLKDNQDQPSAFLYMGIIYQEKAAKDDVLKQTKLAISHMDSAIIHYTKAFQTITEKELKKNSEYYQSYNRRDLRTGEFAIKLSDVQFDLEKRMEGLREKIDRVKMIKHYFDLSDSLYRKTNQLFIKTISPFKNQKEFYLRADKNTLQSLSTLITRFDSSMRAFDQYKASVTTVGKIGYNQTLRRVEIKDIPNDGMSPADFYADDLPVWDYKLFATLAKQALETDIIPMRDHLISYDVEINKLREKVNSDSSSVKSDLTKLIDRMLLGQLTKYDTDPFPLDIFRVKIADLDYKSTMIENRQHKDSINAQFQLSMARRAAKSVHTLDSLIEKLVKRDLDNDIENYKYFVSNTYGNGTVLKSFAKVLRDFAQREKELRDAELTLRERSLQWMVLGADSIPLSLELPSRKFKPMTVVNEKYTAGFNFADSLNASAYFYSITPTRIPDVRVTFPVEKTFRPKLASTAKGVTCSDPSGQVFFVVFVSDRPNKDNKYPATAAKIYRTDGLAWSSNYTLPFVPQEAIFKQETGEFILRADGREAVVDKNGKMH